MMTALAGEFVFDGVSWLRRSSRAARRSIIDTATRNAPGGTAALATPG